MAAVSIVKVQQESFDAAAESAALISGRTDLGAVVTFTGLCRDEGGALAALEIEYYPGMAEAEISRIVDEAIARWPIAGAIVVHRHGLIKAGEPIVLVATASAHRDAAFSAASFLMDYLKTRAPFWKKQHLTDDPSGEFAVIRAGAADSKKESDHKLLSGWVEAEAKDEAAAGKWSG
ncbi:molybdenum cofactor biosynthesis protein MoaE [Methylocapsa palsarum]|uniref:Molybdopterin synthase catalytic subunit n=1 Tax=Methylocapsa palsarum TaxID=1612308 RepID=A0A1I3XEE8_9HYPH|nr:molybdenum cofactor biosynthesis protein MoaE [Methylocapsa palsarum]SFK17885.1 molybdopterin synthase catalytic subunit [Methylocapsa palsarum]